jgi:lysine 6-dehydrogenase
MKIMVLGSGLMGPAAAYNALQDPSVESVLLCDRDADALARAQARLAAIADTARLTPLALNLDDADFAAHTVSQVDVVLAAIPQSAIPQGLAVAARARTPWVDLNWPLLDDVDGLRRLLRDAGTLAILGCGVEPGLTEIMARFLARRFEQVEELHIKCGGIPAEPSGPLGYKIVFGGTQLPLRAADGYAVVDGALTHAPRYGGCETLAVDGVGSVEAWNENFMPWLLDLKELKGLRTGTQKTVRWPGYAHKVTVLKELGLLSTEPVDVDGASVLPKALVDAVLFPHVLMNESDRDITILRVDVVGKRKGRVRRTSVEMVDRFDEATGFTSMARTTAFTGMIVARMVARGEIREKGLTTPEQVVTGKLLARLLKELAAAGIHFELRSERRRVLA